MKNETTQLESAGGNPGAADVPHGAGDDIDGGRSEGEAGFTLVELLVVMAILVLLASIVAPRVIGYLGSSQVKAAKVQIESLSTAIELYRLDNGAYPSTHEGLQALVKRPASAKSWNGPYVKGHKVPADPWGAPYLFRSPGQHGPFDVWSYGADGKAGGDGEAQDITSW